MPDHEVRLQAERWIGPMIKIEQAQSRDAHVLEFHRSAAPMCQEFAGASGEDILVANLQAFRGRRADCGDAQRTGRPRAAGSRAAIATIIVGVLDLGSFRRLAMGNAIRPHLGVQHGIRHRAALPAALGEEVASHDLGRGQQDDGGQQAEQRQQDDVAPGQRRRRLHRRRSMLSFNLARRAGAGGRGNPFGIDFAHGAANAKRSRRRISIGTSSMGAPATAKAQMVAPSACWSTRVKPSLA